MQQTNGSASGGDLTQQQQQQQQQWLAMQQYQQQQWLAMQQYPAAAAASMAMHHPGMMYQQPPPHYMPYHYQQQQAHQYQQQPQKGNQIQTSSEDNKTIWVGDLQHWMDEAYLQSCFAQTGEVASIKLIRNKQTGQSERNGFIEFMSHESAEKALQSYNGTPMPTTADQLFRLNWGSFSTGEKRSAEPGSDLSIFIGDLAPDVTDTILYETFAGRYPSVKGAKVVVDTNTGCSKGYGFVRFSDENERTRAMNEMNGQYCSSRPMRIGVATPKKAPIQQQYGQQQYSSQAGGFGGIPQNSQSDGDSSNTTIFVGGLDSEVTDEDLRQTFSQCGEILSVKIPLGKGCGFVQFASRGSAEDAIQNMHGTVIGKQTVRISWGKTPANRQNGDSYLTLDSLNEFLPQSTTVTDTPTIDVSINGNTEKEPIEHELINSVDACTNLESLEQIDPLTGEEASIFNEDFQIENLSSVSKDAESSLLWESLDILSESRMSAGPKAGKFKPKPKAQTRKVENIHSPSSQIDYMDNASLPSFTPDELLGTSSIGITDSIPTEAIPDFNVNEEPLTFMEMSQVDSVGPSEHLDAIPDTPSVGHETIKKGKTQSSEPSPENEAFRSSERLRRQSKKTFSLIDEFDNDGIGDDIIHRNEDNNNNNNDNADDYRPENESVSEKKGRKSKKPVNEKEKPVRKRKKAGEVPTESTKVKKKFPHSTRRNKRPVNPELLKIPIDEIGNHVHAFPMKELIRLAEYREREDAKKKPPASETPALNQRYENDYDQDANFGEGGGSDYENENGMVAENTTYYNYRTHMKITPRMKWSKQDTELFYEAIQQFGTDLSMIKECFPGRTREQIKSKYKKEEKQQPLRLNDALTTRFKGNSHFEVVIERLKQAQGQDSENEDPFNQTGEENENDVATDNNEGNGVESEKKDEEEMEGDAPAAAGSPTKSHDSDDETYLWSQYKSDI